MTIVKGNYQSIWTNGWWTSSEDIPNMADVSITTVTATSVTFQLDRIPSADYDHTVVKYREHKKTFPDAWVDSGNMTAIGDTVEIAALTEGTLYEMQAYAVSAAGGESVAGAFIYVTPVGTYERLQACVNELENYVNTLVEQTYCGRSVPKSGRKSPFAFIQPFNKVELKSTNLAQLNEYQILVYIGSDHTETNTGETEMMRVLDIIDTIRHRYNNKRDFNIIDLQLTKTGPIDVQTLNKNVIGYTAKMESSIQVNFQVWEENR